MISESVPAGRAVWQPSLCLYWHLADCGDQPHRSGVRRRGWDRTVHCIRRPWSARPDCSKGEETGKRLFPLFSPMLYTQSVVKRKHGSVNRQKNSCRCTLVTWLSGGLVRRCRRRRRRRRRLTRPSPSSSSPTPRLLCITDSTVSRYLGSLIQGSVR